MRIILAVVVLSLTGCGADFQARKEHAVAIAPVREACAARMPESEIPIAGLLGASLNSQYHADMEACIRENS
jgi:hypothetical protein